MTNLVKKVQNTISQYELFERGDKIILAVSGGPDSCALLDIFARLKEKHALELIIAHVNYGLRGKDSQKDEELVRRLAKKHGLEIFVKTVEVQLNKPLQKKLPSEETLRDLRYDFFEKLRNDKHFNLIAVAHNADDQVETYLMRVLRGAGLDGIRAMKFRNDTIIRPLLATPRAEILTYLKENKLHSRIDKSNLENIFLRNKIRNRLIPYLEKNFNPNVRQTITNSLVAITEDLAFLEQETEKQRKKIVELDTVQLMRLHPAILRRFLRKKLAEIKGDLKNVSVGNIEEILKMLKSTKNKHQVVIFKGLKVMRKGDKLEISCTSRSI